jgi:nicotinate-nucleotide adenylyltransferase
MTIEHTTENGRTPVGILGGMFDPVHCGHLRTALEVLEACQLAELRLMPCGQPPHRAAPIAPAGLRLQMLHAAVAGEPRLVVEDLEIHREGPSYTVDSLEALRAVPGATPLCLVLGADAFAGLPSWHRWREITDLCHLIVVHRPGYVFSPGGEAGQLLDARRNDDPRALRQASAGVIRVQQVTALDISSSSIRAEVVRGGDPRYLVPDAVRDIIITTGCYRSPHPGKEAQRRA